MQELNKRRRVTAIVVGAVLWGALTSFLLWVIEVSNFYYVVVVATSVAMAYGFIHLTIREPK